MGAAARVFCISVRYFPYSSVSNSIPVFPSRCECVLKRRVVPAPPGKRRGSPDASP